jgi:cytochrome c oxidase subunit 2
MASSPRTGRLSPATFAVIIGAVMIIGALVVVQASGGEPLGIFQRVVESLYPPAAVTQQGAAVRELYTIVFLIAVVIFFVVEGLIVWTVLRYRRRPQDDELPAQTHGNNIAEIVWTVVPTLIVAFLFVISWNTLNQVDSVSATPETRIRAVAGQFQWKFDYLDASGEKVLYTQLLPTGEDGGLNVPAGRTVLLTLESPDVIHAFYVPQFLFKRDVVPGRVNKFEFLVGASFAGQTFRGQCAELCGAGHAQMLFDVHALTPAAFDAWLADAVAKANASPPPATPAPSAAPGASGAPPASGPPPASGAPAPAGAVVKLSALGVQFEQKDATAPANTPFQIEFENKDAGIPHNVAIHQGSPTGSVVFKGEVFPGVATKTYDVPALPAGAYSFVCTVHPNMTGTLTVN